MSLAVPVIDYIDGPTRRIYLKVGVVNYHPVDDIYKEVRNLRALDENLQKFDNFVIGGGNIKKNSDGSRRTSRYAVFQNCKVVPSNNSHDLAVTGEQLFTDVVGEEPTGSGAACIDKTLLSIGVSVNIDYTPPDTEVQVVSTGSAVTEQDKLDIASATWAHVSALSLLSDMAFVKGIEGGKWEVVGNQMIFYTDDNITEIARFDLSDDTGTPTMTEPYKRVRV